MSINSVTTPTPTNNSLDQLLRQVMSAADTNGDNQLSTSEFGAFLTKLLGHLTTPSTGASSARSGAVAKLTPTPLATYAPMGGFDYHKLNDLGHKTAKYTFARAVQDLGLDGKTSRGNLQPLVDVLKERGFADAKTVGDDKIDFGDGFGPIDVITVSGNWWWGPTQ